MIKLFQILVLTMLATLSVQAQNTITRIVTDNENGDPLFGLNVVAKEDTSVGLTSQTNLKVTMGSSSYNLDQVVVSASKKKEKILNAPASIKFSRCTLNW